MKQRTTRITLGLALIASVVAAWFAPPTSEDGGLLTSNSQGRPKQTVSNVVSRTPVNHRESVQPLTVLAIRSRAADVVDVHVFDPRVVAMVVPPLTAPEAPPTPQAPPLPFRFFGRYMDAGREAFFLQHNDETFVVHVGDAVANQYKVESLVGSSLNLRFLPTNQLQSLNVSNSE